MAGRRFDHPGNLPGEGATLGLIAKWLIVRMHKKTIAIITDKPKSLFSSSYLVRHLIPLWQDRGYRVEISTKWSFPPADIALLHVDFTRVPFVYRLISKKYPMVLNEHFFDNSKAKVSQNLLDVNDRYQGPVIVKTNGNFGGMPDISRDAKGDNRKILKADSDFEGVDWRAIRAIHPENYPVFPGKSDVPDGVWRNRRLVVEKFLPEYDGKGLYRLRACFFFGDREINMVVTSAKPVIKGSNICSRELLDGPAPAELRALREKLKIDFGRLDYVVRDGRVVLYDANKTATLSRQSALEWADRVILPLSYGIEKYL